MTKYNVQLHREVRLTFADIEADSPEAAATIARDTSTGFADRIDDCQDLAALVDLAAAGIHEQSVTIEFAGDRTQKTAQAPGDLNIDAILAARGQIAVTWCVEDVKGVRPDLSDEQCWEVLEEVKRKHDAEYGICWTTLEVWADELFGRAPKTDAAQEA